MMNDGNPQRWLYFWHHELWDMVFDARRKGKAGDAARYGAALDEMSDMVDTWLATSR